MEAQAWVKHTRTHIPGPGMKEGTLIVVPRKPIVVVFMSSSIPSFQANQRTHSATAPLKQVQGSDPHLSRTMGTNYFVVVVIAAAAAFRGLCCKEREFSKYRYMHISYSGRDPITSRLELPKRLCFRGTVTLAVQYLEVCPR